MHKLVIAGSRDFNDLNKMEHTLREYCSDKDLTEETLTIISGTARGADRLGERLAYMYGIPVERYPADWDTYGKRAGYLRNEQMAHACDAAMIFWDGQSRGTKHMIDICQRLNKPVQVIRYDDH